MVSRTRDSAPSFDTISTYSRKVRYLCLRTWGVRSWNGLNIILDRIWYRFSLILTEFSQPWKYSRSPFRTQLNNKWISANVGGTFSYYSLRLFICLKQVSRSRQGISFARIILKYWVLQILWNWFKSKLVMSAFYWPRFSNRIEGIENVIKFLFIYRTWMQKVTYFFVFHVRFHDRVNSKNFIKTNIRSLKYM